MAESQSEDSPLLGGNEPPSPGECSPDPTRGVAPSWSTPFHPHEDAGPQYSGASSWASNVGRQRSCSEERATPDSPRVGVAVTTHKFVHSQTSMDSGCDCDPTDGEAPQATEPPANGGYAPLAPAASASSPSSPGPSGCVAPLARNESLDTGGDGTPLSHTDRGELPKVTFCIGGCVPQEEPSNQRVEQVASNAAESSSQSGSEPGDDFKTVLVKGAAMTFPRVTSYSKPGMLSASSSTASMPMCRICHYPQGEDPDTLISPCRCSGTMQFIHESCLMKWLDVSKSKKTAACELCNYQYNRHKKFRLRHWELPTCSRLDKILHSVFLLCLIVMATCATITIYCFKQDRFIKRREHTDLTKSEIVTLTCGVLFFVAFFMAMYVEVKAKDTLYRLFSRFVNLNQTWHIDDYDKHRDSQHAPV